MLSKYPLVTLDPQQGPGPLKGTIIVFSTLRSFSQGQKENCRAEPSPGRTGGSGAGSYNWLSGSSQEQPKKEEKHACPTSCYREACTGSRVTGVGTVNTLWVSRRDPANASVGAGRMEKGREQQSYIC